MSKHSIVNVQLGLTLAVVLEFSMLSRLQQTLPNSRDTASYSLFVGFALFFLSIRSPLLQWALLTGYVKIWSFFGMSKNDDSFDKLKENVCRYLDSEHINILYYQKVLFICILVDTIVFLLFISFTFLM